MPAALVLVAPVHLLAFGPVIDSWLGSSRDEAGMVALSTVAVFGAVIIYTRIVGLRSFSKMSSFDFAMTVAVGSIMATTAVTPSATLPNALIGLAVLYGVQVVIALARLHLGASRIVDNTPLLLMDVDGFRDENLRRSRVTTHDVWAKVREANVTSTDQIRAVILETTGEISVLSGDSPVDERIFDNVRR